MGRNAKAAVEAALFVATKPLSLGELSRGLRLPEDRVYAALEEIAAELEKEGKPYRLVRKSGGYVLELLEEYAELVRPFAPGGDIPEPILRTLALIAYRGPITQAEVVRIRGQRAYAHIKDLVARGFVRARKEGNTKVLEVTEEFLEYFGLESPGEFRAPHEGPA
ncbi:MAG: SMC-Scp complex subunit ScpB [Caldiserica bacterium]|nr:SMC-Scp complex subunit ScpB [Caldisericota bacterium]